MSETNYLLQNNTNIDKNEGLNVDDLDINQNIDASKEVKNQKISSKTKINDSDDSIVMSKSKLAMVSSLLDTIKESHEKIIQIMSSSLDLNNESRISIGQIVNEEILDKTMSDNDSNGRIIEGVFDGENMIGPDGKQYSVPANYASKSKLVEGDILKLTITPKGTFVYKQIGPIDRSRVVGHLHQTESGAFIVKADNKEWKVLTASVTYYKGQDGDEIIILVPKIGKSKWAAVENIVRKVF